MPSSKESDTIISIAWMLLGIGLLCLVCLGMGTLFIALLMLVPCCLIALIVTLAVWLFERTKNYRIVLGRSLDGITTAIAHEASAERLAAVQSVLIGSSVWLAMTVLVLPILLEQKREDIVATLMFVMAMLIACGVMSSKASALSAWARAQPRKVAGARANQQYGGVLPELSTLVHNQAQVQQLGSALSCPSQDYLTLFDEELARKQASILQAGRQSIALILNPMVAACALRLQRLQAATQCQNSLRLAQSTAEHAVRQARNLDLSTSRRELAALTERLAPLALRQGQLSEYIDVVARLLPLYASLTEQAEQFFAFRREQSRRQRERAQSQQQQTPLPNRLVQAFQVLGLPPDGSLEQAKQSYLRLRRRHHPDTGGTHANTDRFQAVQRAWEVIFSHFQQRN